MSQQMARLGGAVEAGDGGSSDPAVLVVSTRSRTVDRLRLVVAAVGLDAVVAAPDNEHWAASWASARAVLVDVDTLRDVALMDPIRRSHVYVVAEHALPDEAWRWCVVVGVQDAFVLDEAESVLVDRLGLLESTPNDGLILGVLGACGGVGTSTIAAALGLAALGSTDRDCMLIDADPAAGCFDQLLGGAAPGLGWPDLGSLRGRVDGAALGSAIATMNGLPVLTHPRDEPVTTVPADVVRTAAIAAASVLGSAVIDLASDRDELLDLPDVLVVVTTSDVRGGLAARRVADRLDSAVPTICVARTPHRRCLPAAQFSELVEALGAPVWTSEVRRYAARLARGHAVVRPRDRIVREAGLIWELAEQAIGGLS